MLQNNLFLCNNLCRMIIIEIKYLFTLYLDLSSQRVKPILMNSSVKIFITDIGILVIELPKI